MKLFKKNIDKILKNETFESLSIEEILRNVNHCRAHNISSIIKSTEEKVWLNPECQRCFNFGYFSHQDFIDWANGTGAIIKGKTQEEKDIFLKYAKSYFDEKCGYAPLNAFKYLDLFGEIKHLTAPHSLNNYSFSNYDNLELLDSNEIIQKIFSSAIYTLKEDMKSFELSNLRNKWRDESFGIIKTLSLLGKGTLGACNTPTRLDNLSWVSEISFDIAHYLHLKHNLNYDFPNIEYILKNS